MTAIGGAPTAKAAKNLNGRKTLCSICATADAAILCGYYCCSAAAAEATTPAEETADAAEAVIAAIY